MTPLLQRIKELDARRTKGEWYSEPDEDSEDGSGRYTSYRLHAADLRAPYDVLADAINSTASVIEDDRDCDGGSRWDRVAKDNFAFIALLANSVPEIIAALEERDAMREALEKARAFIEHEYWDPALEPTGHWLTLEARPVHDAICVALTGRSHP